MHYIHDLQISDDEYIRKEKYGKCPTCNRCNTNHSWCQLCDPKLLTEGWTSGNETLDELIKSTQLKATKYWDDGCLRWIPYNDLRYIGKIGECSFATLYRAIWSNGPRLPYSGKQRSIGTYVTLKKLHGSQNISDEFLNEVNYLFFYLFQHS